MALLSSFSLAHAADLYVAPNGDDANPGTRQQPFATLDRALAASRAQPAGSTRRILMRGGRYFDVSVRLGPEDSGLTVEAAPGEHPVLYGGVPLRRWKKDGDRFYSAAIPSAQKPPEVRMLEVDGAMAPRARFPAEGTLTHESTFDVPWMSTTGGGWKRKPTQEELTALQYRSGDLGPWLDTKSAEITVYHMWDESCVGIASIDPDRRILTFSSPTGHPPGAFGVKKYVLWNIREGMTGPGRWYQDRTTNRLVYWPLPDQNMGKTDVIAATRETIIRLRGTSRNPVHDITIRGLTFSATTVPLVAAGFAAAAFDGAVSLDNTQDCTLEGLVVARVGGHAINTRGNCTGTRVLNCEVSNCGAGGIYVGGTHAILENNGVHDVGLAYPSAIGINRGGSDCIVRHNEIHGCSYSAINYGGENNLIESNLIYDCMKVLHDGAAIYLFAAKNCIIRGNVARDIVNTGGYGASSYYLDERSEGCVVENNLSLRVAWPTHNHMAKNNTVRNNVFVAPEDIRLSFPRSTDYTLEGNVIYAGGKIQIQNIDGVTAWSKNLFFSKAGKIELLHLKDYQQTSAEPGAPGDTTVGDPLFTDPEKGDFSFKPGSPALALGLKPIDVSAAGRLKGSP